MAPTPIISSISLPSIEINSTTTSRARTQRKRINDDAAYFGPPPPGAIGVKRHAIDKADGEPRVKRKKLDAPNSNGNGIGKRMVDRVSVLEGGDSNVSLIDFKSMSPTTLYAYIAQYDLIPAILPSPLTAHDPLPPFFLQNIPRQGSHAPPSPPPTTTPANRPRREPKDVRRRSSRILDDDMRRTPIMSDVNEFNGVLADIAEKHFRETIVKEVDTLASFMCSVKAKVER